MMRPGRLDRILYVGPPDAAGREEVIRIKLKRMTIGPDVDFKELAQLVRPRRRFQVTVWLINNSHIDGRMLWR